MAQGDYTHPSYLARHVLQFLTTSGANGTSGALVLPWDIDVHQMCAYVVTAGTSSGAGNQVFLLSGTSSVASSSITLGSSTAGVNGTTGDLATKIPALTTISLKNGTDATGVVRVTLEYNINPTTGTWLGVE